MADVASLVAELAAVSAQISSVAPSPEDLCRLRELTTLLVDADADAPLEYARFIGVQQRSLDLDLAATELRTVYTGKRILVTGGTGCIGGQLLHRLRSLDANSVFSVSRGNRAFRQLPGVSYLQADMRDAGAIRDVVGYVQPDVIFHLAAQRDPGRAERAVLETVETNALGTRNLLRAARVYDVPLLLHASTGKAMRYFTGDVYAATKKLSEWLLFDYANEGRHAGGARFTHVVDNSIVLNNFRQALSGGIVRVHDPNIEFYAQSAQESAQLLLAAGISHEPGFWITAIRDLGEPVRLMSMALGVVGERSDVTPVCVTGHEPGYEHGVQPGLYDPRNALELSPLVNALEAASATPVGSVPAVDRFSLTLPRNNTAEQVVEDLARACAEKDPQSVLEMLGSASEQMARASYSAADPATLQRMQLLAERSGRRLPFTTANTDTRVASPNAKLTDYRAGARSGPAMAHP